MGCCEHEFTGKLLGLLALANSLDQIGMYKESDLIDEMIKEAGSRVTLFKGEERYPVLDVYGFAWNNEVCERLKQSRYGQLRI